MATAKDELTKIIQDQPGDSSYDEILRELAFNLMVQRGWWTRMKAELFPTRKCSAGSGHGEIRWTGEAKKSRDL